tara:strand:+ start:950 stop:1099 length:150 start_codon:yes stop_codon:yes gene_type:complete
MLGFLRKKISTQIGLVVIITIAIFAGWAMISQYAQLVETRFDSIQEITG